MIALLSDHNPSMVEVVQRAVSGQDASQRTSDMPIQINQSHFLEDQAGGIKFAGQVARTESEFMEMA